jgi:hypothetical protein
MRSNEVKGGIMQRPLGVTLLAVLSFLTALHTLLAGLLILGTLSFLPQIATLVIYLFGMIAGCGSHALETLALLLQIPLNLISVPYFLSAVLYAAIGLGLLKLQNWARWLVIALCTLELILAAVGYVAPRFLLLRLGILGMAIDVAALVFLFQPKVKEVFEASAN